ncbi:MAG: hypothetical protein IT304_03050 [Dehalococcoidia bacterium]|nr:hypothetical protein [Dehalococcoidia bacterium]
MFRHTGTVLLGSPQQRLAGRARVAAGRRDESRPTVVCSWCDALLEAGDGRLSHGICTACMPVMLETVMKREPAPSPSC